MKRAFLSRRLRVVAALVIGMGLLYAAFELGRSLAGYSALSSFTQRQALSRRVAALKQERDRLAARVAADSVGQKVDREAQSETQVMIGQLQAELARQQQQLDFYRGLVADRFGQGTVKVQELSIRPKGDRRYIISVTLVQTATRETLARGTVTIAVDGSRGGALTQLRMSDVSEDGSDKTGFTLRYFRTIEMPIVLPEGFAPAAVQLEFRSDRTGPDPQKESFPWGPALVVDDEAALTPGPGGE